MAEVQTPDESVDYYNHLTSFEVNFPGVPPEVFNEITPREIILAESLLTPGLQTSVKLNSYVHTLPSSLKMFDKFKGAQMQIKITKPSLAPDYPTTMEIDQVTYRLGGRSSTNPNTTDNRKLLGRTVEELIFHACDPTLLKDAASLVSKSWKCNTPSDVTREVLGACAGARSMNIESSGPARGYIAENIHPFQVVTQQGEAALAGGNDPSFLHFMTFENGGTHHFRSLHTMVKQAPVTKVPLHYNSAGTAYTDVHALLNYVFPCDFDLLSDILNGLGQDGADINSLVLFNPANRLWSLLGSKSKECGSGAGVIKQMQTNQGSESSQDMCPDYKATWALKRQARMGLLEKDKIALRIVVPWNPIYHAGKVIKIDLNNIDDPTGTSLNYGSGNYLISAMTHNIKQGGFSTTTIDAVSQTVGAGEV